MEQPAIMDVGAISTHSLTRRLTPMKEARADTAKHFNSQPHKEADGFLSSRIANANSISTHSLTRRLTKGNSCYLSCNGISTHSLTRRLTFFVCLLLQVYAIFQLTASQGG